jgi:hypothetical protein
MRHDEDVVREIVQVGVANAEPLQTQPNESPLFLVDRPNGETAKLLAALVGKERRRLCNGGVVKVTIDLGFSDRHHCSHP